MHNKKYQLIKCLVLMALLSGQLLFAGTTGKISGRVTDKQTGEPVPGANVLIPGTYLGAATDLDGYFIILQVPPGVHNVEASMVGYRSVLKTGVRVQIDQTASINFEFESEIISADEIVITAERDIIKDDVATSVVAVTPEEIEAMPVTSLNDVVGLQAGIEVTDKGPVIRGGDPDQAMVQMDGVTLRSPRNNLPFTNLPLSSIQEVSVERGGFNAEYGQVRAGIVNNVTREGNRSDYFVSFMTRYSPPSPKYFGISPFDPNSMWNRPFLDPEVCWDGTTSGAWDIYTQRQYPRFDGWNAISQQLLSDENPDNDLSPAAAQRVWQWEHRRRPVTNQPDYNIDAGFGGPVPFIGKSLGNLRFFASYRQEREMLLYPLSRDDYLDRSFTLKFNSDISPTMRLMVSGLFGKSYNVAINENDKQFNGQIWGRSGLPYWSPTDFMRSPEVIARMVDEQRSGRLYVDSWYSEADVASYVMAARLTHTLSSSTYYEAGVEVINNSYETGPIRQRDLTKKYEILPGYFVDEAPYGYDPRPLSGIDGMFFGGHTSTARDTTDAMAVTFKFDLASQIDHRNLVKAGVEFAYNDLALDYGFINTFFGDQNYVKTTKNPLRGAFYVQDKLEAAGFIVNAGLRLDFSNSNTKWVEPEDPFDEDFYSTKYDPSVSYPEVSSETEWTLSPRLAISHPITTYSKLFFNYGHFKQIPTYEQILRIGRDGAGQMRNYGDPNLAQAKTISYELGYDHVIAEDYLLQLAAYYNDISNQQYFTTYLNQKGNVRYDRANNNSYQDIRGFEITLRRSGGNWLRGFANYTYQVGTSGFFGDNNVFESPEDREQWYRANGNPYQRKPVPMPYANIGLTFFTPDETGPKFGDNGLLGDITLNVLGYWQSGEWLTYNPNNAPGIQNNIQLLDRYNLDFRLSKSFRFDPINLTLFADVRNAFNLKYLSGVSFYDSHDQRYYFESLHLPKSSAYDNIPGEDRIGDYRKTGVEFQPIEQMDILDLNNMQPGVIYWSSQDGQYYELANDGSMYQRVNDARMQQILDDKAYIDMPNQTSFNFLNPRQIFVGINLSFNF